METHDGHLGGDHADVSKSSLSDFQGFLKILPFFVGLSLLVAGHAARQFCHDVFEPGSWVYIHVPKIGRYFAEWMADVIHEAGMAFLIAGVVSYFIEARAHRQNIASLNEARKKIEHDVSKYMKSMSTSLDKYISDMSILLEKYISEFKVQFESESSNLDEKNKIILNNAFNGVYALKYDHEYVKAALSASFRDGVVREAFDLDFRIEKFDDSECASGNIDDNKYVKLVAETSYKIKNLNLDPVDIPLNYSLPIRPGFEEISKLTYLKIGSDEFFEEDCHKLMTVNVERGERDYKKILKLKGYDSCVVVTKSELIKDFADSEIFGFRHPTSGATLNVSTEIPTLEVAATERMPTKMELKKLTPNKRQGEWKVDGAILPFNSITVHWRRAGISNGYKKAEQEQRLPSSGVKVDSDILESSPSAQARPVGAGRRAGKRSRTARVKPNLA